MSVVVSVRRRAAEIVVLLAGLLLVALAIGLNQRWFDAHLLPSFFLMRRWYIFLESTARVAMALAGLLLVFVVRPRLGRLTTVRRSGTIPAVIAVVLAIVAGQLVLARSHPSGAWLLDRIEPLRQLDPKLGWTFVPSREGHKVVNGRTISFAFDAHGYRVRSVTEPV